MIKSLCEYLFFDQYRDLASFPRFEEKISLFEVLKEICGERRKYITFRRMLKAYIFLYLCVYNSMF